MVQGVRTKKKPVRSAGKSQKTKNLPQEGPDLREIKKTSIYLEEKRTVIETKRENL